MDQRRPYFQAQNDKDCVIHSFNNAFGGTVIDKGEVLAHIENKVRALASELALRGADAMEIAKKTRAMRDRYSSGTTFFSADIVWQAAKEKGLYKYHVPIPGVSTPYVRMASFTPDVIRHPIVVLGSNGAGRTHAIAVRGGLIYDSEMSKKGPRPLTKENLLASIKNIFSAYAFVQTAEEAAAVKRGSAFVHEI
jgi:hypothetical protein